MSIDVVTGPMYSGKTTELLQRAQRFRYCDFKTVIFKPTIDDRYSTESEVITHTGLKETHNVVVATTLDESLIPEGTNVVCIDEGQFFPNIVTFSEECRKKGYRVIISCLDMTSELKPFPNMGDLFCIADNVTKLKAVCMHCKKCDAGFSKCHVDKKNDVLIGSHGMYTASCLDCF